MRAERMGIVAIIASLIYIGAIVYLHAVQSNYDPVHQFMSELALGSTGWLMLVAFWALGGSLVALGMGLYSTGKRRVIVVLLLIGAGGFSGAGLIRLDINANLHIGLVALAFVAVTISMCLLPSSSTSFEGIIHKCISWGLAAALGVSVALGSGMIPVGISQRLSALFLILWTIWVGAKLSADGENKTLETSVPVKSEQEAE